MGTLPGRSKAEEGKEETEEEGEVRRVDSDVMNAILTAGPIESVTSGDVVQEMRQRRCSWEAFSSCVAKVGGKRVGGEIRWTGSWVMR